MQYTIRGIPTAVDEALRKRARSSGKSLNEVTIEALAEGAGVAGAPRRRRDLRALAASWKPDAELLAELAAQDQVDEELWR
jgi:hypothetical protein